MIKQLAGAIRQYKKDAILAPVLVTLEVLMEVLIPFLMANMIDYGINAGNMNTIISTGGILVLFALLSLLFGALAGKYAARASAGFARNLRQDIYYRVQNFSFSNIDKFSTSSLVTRLTTDITNVQNAFQMIIRVAVRAPVMLLFSLIMAFSINSQLSLVFFCATPFLGVGLFLIISRVYPLFERVFRTYDRLNSVVQENVHSIRVVKSFVREDHEKEKFGKVSQTIYQYFSKAEKLVVLGMPLMQSVMYICTLLISWFGAMLIVGGSMTTGQLTSFFAYLMQILLSLMMFSVVFVNITISRPSARRIVEVIEDVPDLRNPDKPIYHVSDGSVSFKNVDFSYTNNPDKLCLSDINLDVKSGETVGVIGGTGSSKTTLVQLIPRLYDVTKGAVTVGGVDVRDYDIKTLRNEVAMVLQKNVLFSGTIKENLCWGNKNATDAEIVHACELAQADEFIRSFPKGYDTYLEQGGSNVSGGQKQRLCIARALLKRPKILILDDSTSAVDTKTDALIRRAFREEIPGTTKFIVAQRVASVEDADKIIVMDGGKINAVGTHEDLLKNNLIYQEVYYSQAKGGNNHDA
ncbi:MAG: ABC transporter ATP-binding protein/permease [Candidatus Bathyarchaeota archaeon]|nr:ABC transporter ATP-binding protein/permease [Candidatus Bathyarchaeum sp.]